MLMQWKAGQMSVDECVLGHIDENYKKEAGEYDIHIRHLANIIYNKSLEKMNFSDEILQHLSYTSAVRDDRRQIGCDLDLDATGESQLDQVPRDCDHLHARLEAVTPGRNARLAAGLGRHGVVRRGGHRQGSLGARTVCARALRGEAGAQ